MMHAAPIVVGLLIFAIGGWCRAATTYTYDALGRLTKAVYSSGPTITYAYDALGNRTSRVVSGVPSISPISGTRQIANFNSAFGQPLKVKVTDSFGNASAGATVALSVPGAGASANCGVFPPTDASGVTQTTCTANGVAGSYVVSAAASGIVATAMFSLTNVAGPSVIIAVGGTPQNASINTAFGQPLGVKVTDSVGNASAGVTVALTVPSTGASANCGVFPVTDASGVTQTNCAANGLAGSYVASAAVAGISATATFSLTNSAVASGIVVTVTKAGTANGTVNSDPVGIDCGVTCSQSFPVNTSVTLTATAASGSIFTGWLGACTGSGACTVNTSVPKNVSATFAPNTIVPRADIDGNNTYGALTDGLLVLRYLFGLTGTSLTTGAIGNLPTRTTAADIAQYIDNVKPWLDIDGNGQVDALTDGLLLIRYMFGLRGPMLIDGLIGAGATRATAMQIESYLQSLTP